MNERWVTIGEVAEKLGISWPTAKKRLLEGDIPGLVKHYGYSRIEKIDFEKWLAELKLSVPIRLKKHGSLHNEQDVIYFMVQKQRGESPIKIGFSSAGRLAQRFCSLKQASPYPLKLLGTVPGSRAREQELHQKFKADRLRGEWFRPSENLRKFLETLGFQGSMKKFKI